MTTQQTDSHLLAISITSMDVDVGNRPEAEALKFAKRWAIELYGPHAEEFHYEYINEPGKDYAHPLAPCVGVSPKQS